jgi:hypothetical protein
MINTTGRRYVAPMNEAALYTKGVAAWRTDVQTYGTLQHIVTQARWLPDPDERASQSQAYIPDLPVGALDDAQKDTARNALQNMLNDPSLVPNLRMLGVLQVKNIELQNGALDPRWHHDGLSGRARGHAGQFFCLSYFNAPKWDDAWGGHLEYGTRALKADWPCEGFDPDGNIGRIAPAGRTTILGWNENPCFVHRTAPMLAPRDRITMIASVSIASRT